MNPELTLTAAEQASLDELVPQDEQTGDVRADLIGAAKEALRRRAQNSRDGGRVLTALHRDAGSWRSVAYVTGIPHVTARRWSLPVQDSDDESEQQT